MGASDQVFELRDQREPGWFYIDNELLDDYGAELGPYGIAVYSVLSRHWRKDQKIELSNRDIASTLGISHDRVRKSLTDLVRLGLIKLETPAHPAPGSVSRISLGRVKATGRHTSSSTPELDATRPRNKERKTNTKQIPPNPPAGGRAPQQLTPRQLKDLTKTMDRLAEAQVGTGATEEQLLRAACARLFIPLDAAREAQARSYGAEFTTDLAGEREMSGCESAPT